jgi:hypothetical protein
MLRQMVVVLRAKTPELQILGGLGIMAWAGEHRYYWVATAGLLIAVEALLEVYVMGRRRG